MSKWNHGCGETIEVYVPRGYDYKARNVECGSTAYDGGVNQCDACAAKYTPPLPYEDEGDMEYSERIGWSEE